MSKYPEKYDGDLGRIYTVLRTACIDLERNIEAGANNGLTAKELMRFDKAVTVMKVGFKIMKKALRKAKPVKLKAVA